MKAKDVMTRSVVSVEPSATVLHAVRLMLQKKISGLPVVDTSGRLVGIVTEGDFLRRVETGTQRRRPRWIEFLLGPGHLADEYTHTHGRKVEEVMTTEPLSVTEDTSLEEVVNTMEKHRIKRVGAHRPFEHHGDRRHRRPLGYDKLRCRTKGDPGCRGMRTRCACRERPSGDASVARVAIASVP